MHRQNPSQKRNNTISVSIIETFTELDAQQNILLQKIVPKFFTILTKVIFSFLAVLLSAEAAFAVPCPSSSDVSIVHQPQSYSELCGVGSVTIRFTYEDPSNPPITNIVIRENFGTSGLVPIPGTTTFSVNYGSAPTPIDPVFSGGQWEWDLGTYILDPAQNSSNDQYLDITFEVRRANGEDEEGLYTANRSLTASMSYTTDTHTCGALSNTSTISLNRPQPTINKLGRNVDADQGSFRDTIYGHNNDDVIWRIQIDNNGLADMQDVRFDDVMNTGNMAINYACASAGSANTIAGNNGGGAIPGDCVAASNTLTAWPIIDPFGAAGTTNWPNGDASNGFTRNLNGRDIDVDSSSSEYIYLVGKITANGSCNSGGETNTVSDLEIGCEADANGVGGIPIPSADDDATLLTYHDDVNNQLTVQRRFTGVDTLGTTTVSTQPMGTRGLVTITITNNTGGTVDDIYLEDVLPPQYVIDPTFWSGGTIKNLPARWTPVVGQSSIRARFGSYAGMIDRLEWLNPQGVLTSPSQDPLLNTTPQFRLYSSTSYTDNGVTYENLLRQFDVLTVTFPVVLISQDRSLVEPYDLAANLDVTPEITGDGTDPAYTSTLSNTLTIDYDTFCPTQGNNGAGHYTFAYTDNNIAAFPEDLDIAINGNVFILTNTEPLDLQVTLTNNGGHNADDYYAYITFGATMDVIAAPGSCATTSNPPALPVWTDPAAIPGPASSPPAGVPATVYLCTGTAIGPGQTNTYDFQVEKSSIQADIDEDDLTFRADVVGQITLNDGTPLWFPTPAARSDGEIDPANNYTLDGVRARVIGFNLLKTQVGFCTENNTPLPAVPDLFVQIGEECTFHIDTGGWFGFLTPGFTYIAVQNIQVVDEMPDGQGYISSTSTLR